MLTGYRVLDISQFVAGPTCTRILAELGAEVIKLELAPFGDRGRFSGDKPGIGAYVNLAARTKRADDPDRSQGRTSASPVLPHRCGQS